MKYSIIIIICFGLLTNCTYRPREKRLSKFKNNDGKILTSFYRQKNDTIEFKRIVAHTSSITVQSGQIFLDEYALTHQQFTTVEKFNHDSRTIDSLTSQIAKRRSVTVDSFGIVAQISRSSRLHETLRTDGPSFALHTRNVTYINVMRNPFRKA